MAEPDQSVEAQGATAMERSGWRAIPELGTVWGIRLLVLWSRVFGRGAARLMTSGLALYYTLFRSRVRRSSREYLRRLGQPSGFWSVFAHARFFGLVALDRMFFIQGEHRPFKIHLHGHEHLVTLRDQKQGAILLGAHMGSFEVGRSQSVATDIPLNVIGDFSNAARVNGVLQRLNPAAAIRFIGVRPGDHSFIFEARDAIERGELVAILGDRAGHGGEVEVDFLGGRIRLPSGPYVMAAVLGCPVYLTFGLHTPPNRYDLYCEPFADRVELPRRGRHSAVQQYAQRYADRVAEYCAKAPLNWFNFYDYWLEAAPRIASAPTLEARSRSEVEKAVEPQVEGKRRDPG